MIILHAYMNYPIIIITHMHEHSTGLLAVPHSRGPLLIQCSYIRAFMHRNEKVVKTKFCFSCSCRTGIAI